MAAGSQHDCATVSRIGKGAAVFIMVAGLALLLCSCGKAEAPKPETPVKETASVVSPSDKEAISEKNGTLEPAEGESADSSTEEPLETNHPENQKEDTEKMLQLKIDDTIVNVSWEENESVLALKGLCKDSPLVVQMSMYGGFEQVGSLGASLPREDEQTTTESGDIVLYSGNQIVVFYGSNSWSYTRLGHITDQDSNGMKQLLSNGDVTVTISMEEQP